MIDNFLKHFKPLKLEIRGVRLPEYIVENKYKEQLKLAPNSTNYDFLRALCYEGFKKLNLKKGSDDYKKYAERVKYELTMFQDLGFVDYILLVWDVMNFCKEKDIPTGMGRGSGVSSACLYLIGVTKVDPIKYDLYIERFISKIRAKKTVIDGITYLFGELLPDCDLDLSYYRRNEVVDYVNGKFPNKTCKIITFNTLSSKLLIKEMGKIIGMKSEEEMTNVSSMVPKLHGVVEDLDKAYESVTEFKKWCDENKRVYDTAIKLNGLVKNTSLHASATLISYENLEDSCPVQLTSDKELVSSYGMDIVSMFAVKLDLLGLKCADVVDDVCKALKIKVEDINVNDPSLYLHLQDFKHSHGIFQLEQSATKQAAQKIKPKNLEELSAVISLSRPGAMQFIDQYASFCNTGSIESIHPFFDKVLKETGNLCIYQESLMRMLNSIGFSLDEAETCRKIVGKKLLDKVKEWQQKIKDKVKETNLDPEIGNILWEILNNSASYSFNKSHSLAYCTMSAICIYLKFKYSQQFFLSLLKMTKAEPNPISEVSKIHKEMHHFGIELLPPSLTHSKMDFTIEGKDIRMGLSNIKGIGEKVLEKLNNFKREHANKFELFQCAKEAGLSIGHVASMTQAGMLSKFGANRFFMVYECQLFSILTDKEKKSALDLGKEFNYNLPAIIKVLLDKKNDKGKPIIPASRFETIKKRTTKYKAIYEQNKVSQDWANHYYEWTLLGFIFSKKLKEIYKEKVPNAEYIDAILELKENTEVEFVGKIIENGKSGISKNKNPYYKYAEVSDETGSIKVMIFNDSYESCKNLHNGKMPQKDDLIIIKGVKKGDDTVFANIIAKQLNTVYKNLADLKDVGDKVKSISII